MFQHVSSDEVTPTTTYLLGFLGSPRTYHADQSYTAVSFTGNKKRPSHPPVQPSPTTRPPDGATFPFPFFAGFYGKTTGVTYERANRHSYIFQRPNPATDSEPIYRASEQKRLSAATGRQCNVRLARARKQAPVCRPAALRTLLVFTGRERDMMRRRERRTRVNLAKPTGSSGLATERASSFFSGAQGAFVIPGRRPFSRETSGFSERVRLPACPPGGAHDGETRPLGVTSQLRITAPSLTEPTTGSALGNP